MERNWTAARFPLALAIILAAAFLITMLTAGGNSGDGELTPDVAARLETQASDAARDAEEALEATAEEAMDALPDVSAGGIPAANQPGVSDCIELLEEGAYAEALAACTEALAADPANEDLQKAVEEARQEATTATVEGGALAEDAEAELQGALGSVH